MERKIEIQVDKQLCIGNQMCIEHAGAVFHLDASGQSEAGDPSAEPLDRVVAAALECPVGAISVTDADTGEDLVVD